MTKDEESTESHEFGEDSSDGRGVGPCDVWPPRAGPCGGGKSWVFNPVLGQWECK